MLVTVRKEMVGTRRLELLTSTVPIGPKLNNLKQLRVAGSNRIALKES
jgi:hypothetical protein